MTRHRSLHGTALLCLLALAACNEGVSPASTGATAAGAIVFSTRTSFGPDEEQPDLDACQFNFGLTYGSGMTPHQRAFAIREKGVQLTPYDVIAEVPDADGLGVTKNGDGTVTAGIYQWTIVNCDIDDSNPFVIEITEGECLSGDCPPVEIAQPAGPVPTRLEVIR